jgi:hypothetical protein
MTTWRRSGAAGVIKTAAVSSLVERTRGVCWLKSPNAISYVQTVMQ